MVVTVRLTWDEVEQAALLGVRRYTRSRRAARADAHGLATSLIDVWATDIEGAAAEMAVAKATNRFWCGSLETFDGDDVKGGIQVRYAKGADAHLIVRPTDANDHRFVLVTGAVPTFVVRGWVFGYEAKEEEWRRAPNGRPPCFMVPQTALHAVELLCHEPVARELAQ
jgi:hypothetical protein